MANVQRIGIRDWGRTFSGHPTAIGGTPELSGLKESVLPYNLIEVHDSAGSICFKETGYTEGQTGTAKD